MRMLLRPCLRCGPFGDPALYIRLLGVRDAMLFDCGDLTPFSTRELLRISHIFLSHCHIDHFFGFDLYLRVHVGIDKCTRIFGPPETSERVAGRLRGYTWNLIRDKNMEFEVTDLDSAARVRRTTSFHSRDCFSPSRTKVADWDPQEPVVDAGIYRVHAAVLDHHTPSMAYAIHEKQTVSVNAQVLRAMELKPGPWIDRLKRFYLFDALDQRIDATDVSGSPRSHEAADLARQLLLPRQRHKIAYVTDGAATEQNREKILALIAGADILYSETCFSEADEALARKTMHFTTRFIGETARRAGVKALVPFHFSKRYLENPEQLIAEVSSAFGQKVTISRPIARA